MYAIKIEYSTPIGKKSIISFKKVKNKVFFAKKIYFCYCKRKKSVI